MEAKLELQPTLRGALIEARPLLAEDFETLFLAASDPLIWEQHPEPDRYKREVFQRYFDQVTESGGALAVLDRASKRIIGSSTYYHYDSARGEVVIGYTFLQRSFWGRGYNRELKSLMLDHAFRSVDRVLFEVGAGNVRSQKALLKIGAELLNEVELPDFNGRMLPYLVFGVNSPSTKL